jgi:hypothetical protein
MTTAEIEIRKLQATFLNSLAVQLVAIGALAPSAALWLKAFAPERAPVDPVPMLVMLAMCALSAGMVHLLALDRLRTLP